jgi:hypothetical protein
VSHAIGRKCRSLRPGHCAGLLVLLALALAGCGRKQAAEAPTAPVTAEGRAAALEQRLGGSTPSVAGRWEEGGTSSHYQAWFERDQPVYLTEEQSLGELGGGSYQYYFADGRLYYYRGQERRTITTGGAAGATQDSRVEAEFADGRVVRATRLAHEGEIRLEAAAIDALQRHVTALVETASDEYSAVKLTAPNGG